MINKFSVSIITRYFYFGIWWIVRYIKVWMWTELYYFLCTCMNLCPSARLFNAFVDII